MTSEEIRVLLDNPPDWLRRERETQAGVRTDRARLASRNADRERSRKQSG